MVPRAGPRSGSDGPVPFDRVLAAAHDDERARLTRFRRRWIARHLVALALAVGVLVVTGLSLVGSPSSALAWFVVGGWLASLFTVGLFGIAAIAVPFLVGRIVAVVRTDDLAGYERNRQPWWESAR